MPHSQGFPGSFCQEFMLQSVRRNALVFIKWNSLPLTGLWEDCPGFDKEPPPKWRDVIAENPLRANKRSGR